MPYQTWIADVARAFGLPVEEHPGWTSRGSSSFNPGGVVAHWTAGPCGATGRPSLGTVVDGRSDLPGPLANVYLDRQGVCVIVAAGRANHAGDGGYRGLVGNSSVLGVEAECCNAGDWTEAQHQNYPVLLAALVAGVGRDETWICRHCDWTTRKIDINDWPLADLQAGAAAALEGDIDMGLTADERTVLDNVAHAVVPVYEIADGRYQVRTIVTEQLNALVVPALNDLTEAVARLEAPGRSGRRALTNLGGRPLPELLIVMVAAAVLIAGLVLLADAVGWVRG